MIALLGGRWDGQYLKREFGAGAPPEGRSHEMRILYAGDVVKIRPADSVRDPIESYRVGSDGTATVLVTNAWYIAVHEAAVCPQHKHTWRK